MEGLVIVLMLLLVASIISGAVEHQSKKKAEKDRDEWKIIAQQWEHEHLECKNRTRQQITELKKDRDEWETFSKIEHRHFTEACTKMRTTWHAHQIVKKGKQVICLTAIVTAEDGPGAVAAFEAQMKEVKAQMRIRSKAPVFAKPVFPNY